MARYCSLADCTDPVVRVDESDLDAADRRVLALLRGSLGVEPDDVTSQDGLDLLRDLASAEATAAAARRQAVEGDSGMWRKWEAYRSEAREAASRINRESLGIEAAGSGASGYTAIPLGRA